MKHILSTFAAALLLMIAGAACQSSPENVNETVLIESDATVTELLQADLGTAESDLLIEPGKLLIAKDFSPAFHLRALETETNEEGLLVARVFAKTDFDSCWSWLFCGESAYKIAYRFIWFDAEGKLLPDQKAPQVTQVRENLPGDMVRFSDVAPNEKSKKFSICIGLVK